MHTKAAAEAEAEPEPLQDLAQGSGFIFLKPWAVKAEPKPRVLKPSWALTSLLTPGCWTPTLGTSHWFVGCLLSAAALLTDNPPALSFSTGNILVTRVRSAHPYTQLPWLISIEIKTPTLPAELKIPLALPASKITPHTFVPNHPHAFASHFQVHSFTHFQNPLLIFQQFFDVSSRVFTHFHTHP